MPSIASEQGQSHFHYGPDLPFEDNSIKITKESTKAMMRLIRRVGPEEATEIADELGPAADKTLGFVGRHGDDALELLANKDVTTLEKYAEMESNLDDILARKANGFENSELLSRHWDGSSYHKNEFPEFGTAEEYQAYASEVAKDPTSKKFVYYHRGEIPRYGFYRIEPDGKTITFVVLDENGYIRTCFRPPSTNYFRGVQFAKLVWLKR